jgi:LuxR family maltose regulon positive regulatory protein
MALGRTLLRQGEFLASSRALQDAVLLASNAEAAGPLAECLGLAALTAAASGRLRRARALSVRSEAAAEIEANGRTPWAGLAAGWAACESRDLSLAAELLDEAAGASRRATDPLATAVAALLRARLLRADGKQDAARGTLCAAEELLPDGGRATWPGTLFAVELGEAAATSVRVTEAGEVALAVAVERDLENADSALERGDPVAAVPLLVRALDLAAQEDVRRPFVEASEPVRALLTTRDELAIRCPWLTGDREAPTAREPGPISTVTLHGQVITPLTHREQEVLTLLADLLTTDEIAESLFVSVNTVRTHIRSVLCKLGANRRNEAVRRAWELGLLERGGPQPATGLRGMTG